MPDGSWSEARPTNCHLIIDVVNTDKPLWIVYRWKGYTDGTKLVKRAKFDRDVDCFMWMEANQCSFDIAQVGKKFEDWISEDGSTKNIPYFEGLMKQTGVRDTFPDFSSPTFFGLKEELGFLDVS